MSLGHSRNVSMASTVSQSTTHTSTPRASETHPPSQHQPQAVASPQSTWSYVPPSYYERKRTISASTTDSVSIAYLTPPESRCASPMLEDTELPQEEPWTSASNRHSLVPSFSLKDYDAASRSSSEDERDGLMVMELADQIVSDIESEIEGENDKEECTSPLSISSSTATSASLRTPEPMATTFKRPPRSPFRRRGFTCSNLCPSVTDE